MDTGGNTYPVTNGLVTVPLSTLNSFTRQGFQIPRSLVYGPGIILLGSLIGANMNTLADQPIAITGLDGLPVLPYAIESIHARNGSISLTTAVGGVYTAAAKGGTAIVANTQVYTGLAGAATDLARLTVAAAGNNSVFTAATLYLALTTAQGAAATADIYVFGRLYQ